MVKRQRHHKKASSHLKTDGTFPGKTSNVPEEEKVDKPEFDDDYVHYSSSEERPSSPKKRPRPSDVADDASDSNDIDVGEQNGEDSEVDMSEEAAEMDLDFAAADESDVEVSFDFHDPREGDVTAILPFLSKWVRRLPAFVKNGSKSETDFVMALAKTVCSQSRVGVMVRTDENEPAIAFITCLNIRRHASLLQPLLSFLHAKAGVDSPFGNLVKRCSEGDGRFEKEKMGLILTERVVNLPPLLLPKLYEGLFSEVEWAVEDEPTEEGKEDFRLGWFLCLSELYESDVAGEEEAKKNPVAKDKQKSKSMAADASSRQNFTKVEDDSWLKHAAHHITWALPNDSTEKGLKKKGLAVITPAKRIKSYRTSLAETVGFIDEGIEGGQEEGHTEG